MSHSASVLVDQLVEQGITQFCIAPGSRSTPLVVAATSHPKVKTIVHFDERGLGFYALGFGKGAKKGAALIVTSGTAVGNLLPAVMEAHASATPLFILSSDRPHELRETGANQTCDQVKIFSSYVRWQMDLAPHLSESAIRSIAAQAVFHASSPHPGPIHLNCPFQDPLYAPIQNRSHAPLIPLSFPKLIAPPFSTSASRGVIILGQVADPQPVLKLAKRLQWPVFADILSNARCTPTEEQVRHFDYLIRSSKLQPDLLLHLGERLTSKHVLEWSKNTPLLHVSPYPKWQDPARRLKERILSDIAPFCETMEAKTDPHWLSSWQAEDRAFAEKIGRAFDSPFTEPHLYGSLPYDRPLFLGNGLPIRDADHFFFPPSHPGFFANRGLSGIDGNIATVAGLSDGLGSPLIAVIGDQAALYDLNSLPLLKDRPILLIVSNNFGGGIFEHLPVAKAAHFETHWAAAHSWTFKKAAALFDLPYSESLDLTNGVVEITSNRKESYQFQCSLATL